MAGQTPIQRSELPDTPMGEYIFRCTKTSGDDDILFVADRDCWLNQAWIRPSAGGTNNSITLAVVPDGSAPNASSGDRDITGALGDDDLTADTISPFSVAANNFIPQGYAVVLRDRGAGHFGGINNGTDAVIVGVRVDYRRA